MSNNQLTINIGNRNPSNKWVDGTSTKGKFAVLVIDFEESVVSGTGKNKDGTDRPWSYVQLANITDGRKVFAGGKCYGTDDKKHPVTIKVLGKLMPAPDDKKSSPAVTTTGSELA